MIHDFLNFSSNFNTADALFFYFHVVLPPPLKNTWRWSRTNLISGCYILKVIIKSVQTSPDPAPNKIFHSLESLWTINQKGERKTAGHL